MTFSAEVLDEDTTSGLPEIRDAPADESLSASTRRNYAGAWNRFRAWASDNGHTSLPATSEAVEEYLKHRHANGRRPSSLKADRAAIRHHHRRTGRPVPSDSPVVRRLLQDSLSRPGQDAQEVTGLTGAHLARIRDTATKPRRQQAGRFENEDAARVRGLVDLALISTMRDALLRRSEAATLRWDAIDFLSDGTGRLNLARRPVQYLSPRTVEALRAIQTGDVPADALVFGLKSGRSISNRIKAAAAAAGLRGNFTASSPRIGMAEDLDRAGIRLSALEVTRRWHDARMPDLVTAAYYVRGAE
ncbi:MAG: site-specific integrase [Gemmatimonadetes bacterium]|nr:site-specific integrase [Gemmatimonadota bacterium]